MINVHTQILKNIDFIIVNKAISHATKYII